MGNIACRIIRSYLFDNAVDDRKRVSAGGVITIAFVSEGICEIAARTMLVNNREFVDSEVFSYLSPRFRAVGAITSSCTPDQFPEYRSVGRI